MSASSPPSGYVLTINGGSSSLKFAVFSATPVPERRLSGKIERIGLADSTLTIDAGPGTERARRPVPVPDQSMAGALVILEISRRLHLEGIVAVGHRIVHGGPRFVAPRIVTPEVLDELRKISPLDPEHLPGEIELLEAFTDALPATPQVACFDTAFHRAMPRVARIVPIPRKYEALGVRRYGFHGLSYEYLLEELARVAGHEEARGRVILAHLGAGASLAAVRDGHCLDTSMGFTPTAGLVMGTRSGDLDPGLVRFLADAQGLSPESFHKMVNHESGLVGISETSPDIRDLLDRRDDDVRAAEAVDVFCYHVKKWIGAFAAVLGGLDSLVFSAGIGENSPEIRSRVCAGLGFLGLSLDTARNAENLPLISTDESRVTVRVIPTDEELVIARETIELATGGS